MGSTIEVLLVGNETAQAEAIATFALAEALAAEWERTFSRFIPDSEISRLNAQAGQSISVSERLFTAIEIAIDGTRLSGGLFDPTILPALVALGYDRTFDQIVDDGQQVPGTHQVPGVAGISLDSAQRVVTLSPGTQIDLGGVVKGLYSDILAGTGSSGRGRGLSRWRSPRLGSAAAG